MERMKRRINSQTVLLVLVVLAALLIHNPATYAQTGDFNGDGLWDCRDAFELSRGIITSGSTQTFDLNGDGELNQGDMINWLGLAGEANLGPGESYVYGDLDLDGWVDNGFDTDTIRANVYTNYGSYCEGDLNLDGRVDAFDNAIVHANLFSNYQSVTGAGSDGTPTQGLLDYIYDPNSGKMWVDAGSDVLNGWAIPGPAAIEHNELSELFSFGTLLRRSTFFAGAEQITNRGGWLTGIYQISTYPTDLTEADFGEIISTRLPDGLIGVDFPLETLPAPTSPRTSRVVVATINQWSGGSGNWISSNWQDGAAPQPGQVAILDFGSESITINANDTATSIKTLVRSGTLTINGTHAGDLSVFDTSATPDIPPNSAMAAISGQGRIEGDLALMGRFRLEEAVTLTVTGKAFLAEGFGVVISTRPISGQARLDVSSDFALASGDSTGEFSIITAEDGIDGVFSKLSVGDEFGIGDLFVESLVYAENDVLISLGRSIPGDANRDGFVDVSDFNLWNDSRFTSDSAWGNGDFNGDGYIDTADFNIWNENKFTSTDLTAVPEPSVNLLAAFCAIAFACCQRRRRQ